MDPQVTVGAIAAILALAFLGWDAEAFRGMRRRIGLWLYRLATPSRGITRRQRWAWYVREIECVDRARDRFIR